MLIIINDDPFYRSWLARHRAGFVLDSYRRPSKRRLVWHRAACPDIKSAKRAHGTSGTHLKACSLDPAELAAWARDETGGELQPCPTCRPDDDSRAADRATTADGTSRATSGRARLTPLGRRIMDHVLELAAMRLGGESPDYRITVGQLAQTLGKSLAQIGSPLSRLARDGQISLNGHVANGSPLAARADVFPTRAALRSLPAFANLADGALDRELDRLRGGCRDTVIGQQTH